MLVETVTPELPINNECIGYYGTRVILLSCAVSIYSVLTWIMLLNWIILLIFTIMTKNNCSNNWVLFICLYFILLFIHQLFIDLTIVKHRMRKGIEKYMDVIPTLKLFIIYLSYINIYAKIIQWCSNYDRKDNINIYNINIITTQDVIIGTDD